MSIQQNIARIQEDKLTIRDKLVEAGLVESTANLDTLAEALDEMEVVDTESVEIKEGESYNIVAGYHKGGTVTGIAGGGDYDLQTKTVTPTKSQQTVSPDTGYYGLSSVTVNAIPQNYADVSRVTANAGDVLVNKSFVNANGVETAGSMADNGTVTKTLNTTTTTYTIPAGKHSGNGTVTITLEQKSATPTTSSQNIVPSTGKVLEKVIVDPIPSNYANTTDATIDASEVLSGQVAYGYNSGTSSAVKITGTMTNNGDVSGTITGLGSVSGDTYVDIPAGYTSGGRVSLTNDIETALSAI